jgi:hypothetical protein
MKKKKDFMEMAFDRLPEYIDDEYPKGRSKERGKATVHIVLYLNWLKQQIHGK